MNKTITINKTVLVIIVALLALGGIIWFARPNSEKKTAATSAKSDGSLTVEDESSYDFGTVSMANGKVKHDFKIKNTSGEAVIINKIYTSCMCTTAVLIKGDKQFGPYGMPGHGFIPNIDQGINTNEETTVEITFDPSAHGPSGVGRIQRIVTIENNAGQPIELTFSAVVTP